MTSSAQPQPPTRVSRPLEHARHQPGQLTGPGRAPLPPVELPEIDNATYQADYWERLWLAGLDDSEPPR